MTNQTQDAERLWELSQLRADELGKELQDIASEAEMSLQTLYQWRKGNPVRSSNDRRIHLAFAWELESRKAILGGGEPTPRQEATPQPEHAPPTKPKAEQWRREAIRELFRGMSLAEQEDYIRELEAEVAEPRRQEGAADNPDQGSGRAG
ncbi:hypothetical protein ACWGI8_41630 [Streptomyces sp. NPDC054841]